MVLSAQSRGLVTSSAQRLNGQRSNSTTMTMTRRRPTEPPPIQMALARNGEDNSNMVFLSFLMAIRLPSFSGVKLRYGPGLSYGV
jgi:hypothetical protein